LSSPSSLSRASKSGKLDTSSPSRRASLSPLRSLRNGDASSDRIVNYGATVTMACSMGMSASSLPLEWAAVCCVDSWGAAALNPNAIPAADSSSMAIRILPWPWSRPRAAAASLGKPIHIGDVVTLQNRGNYLSLKDGWWFRWTSCTPKRSGSFTVDIIDRAGGSSRGSASSGSSSFSSKDTVLLAGDVFRLRSVKFPEFELAMSSKRVGGQESVYLALHRISVAGAATANGDCASPMAVGCSTGGGGSALDSARPEWSRPCYFKLNFTAL